MEGHLEYQGSHAWSNETAMVVEAADLKVLFIKIIYSFIQIPDADVKCYPLQFCIFMCVRRQTPELINQEFSRLADGPSLKR